MLTQAEVQGLPLSEIVRLINMLWDERDLRTKLWIAGGGKVDNDGNPIQSDAKVI